MHIYRWIIVAMFAGALAVSSYHRGWVQGGEAVDRSREAGVLITFRLLIGLLLFGGLLVYVLNPSWMHWAAYDGPIWLRWVGAGIGVAALPLFFWIFSTLGRNLSGTTLTFEEQELVVRGPYRWVRHPLYTVGGAFFAALGLVAANWFILTASVVALVGFRTVIVPREERELVETFGPKYCRYAERTGAMFPRIPVS